MRLTLKLTRRISFKTTVGTRVVESPEKHVIDTESITGMWLYHNKVKGEMPNEIGFSDKKSLIIYVIDRDPIIVQDDDRVQKVIDWWEEYDFNHGEFDLTLKEDEND